jgi:tripartite-type tricarboxylate transporter receptor subunit TctC
MKHAVKRMSVLIAACTIGAGAAVTTAHAQANDYPNRPIRMIVPFSPGGGADSLARPLADGLSKRLGQTVVVENRSGAGSNIGTAIVADANPDGYTFLLNTDAIAIYPFLYANLKYDWKKDLTPVSYVARSPLVLAINKDVPAKTLTEFVDLAKKKPGSLNFANPGMGSPHHLGFELFVRETGIDVAQIPYNGGGPSLINVLGGHVQIGMFTFGAVNSQFEKGGLTPLAVLTRERSTALAPNLPTAVELGYDNVQADLRFVVMAPANTPAPIVEKMHKEIAAVVNEKSFTSLLNSKGYEPFVTTPAQTADILDQENTRWAPIIKDLKIQLE